MPVFSAAYWTASKAQNNSMRNRTREEQQLLKGYSLRKGYTATSEWKRIKRECIFERQRDQSRGGTFLWFQKETFWGDRCCSRRFYCPRTKQFCPGTLGRLKWKIFRSLHEFGQWGNNHLCLVNGIGSSYRRLFKMSFSQESYFISSMCIFMVGTLVCAAAPSFAVLTAAGVLLSDRGRGNSAPLVAYIAMLVFQRKRGTAMGMAGICRRRAQPSGL